MACMEANLKDEAKRLIDSLDHLDSWDQLIYEIYVRQTIEKGMEDSTAGRTVPVEDVRREFGLEP